MTSRYDRMVEAAVWLAKQGCYIGHAPARMGKTTQVRWKDDMSREEGDIRSFLRGGSTNALVIAAGQVIIVDDDKAGWHDKLVAAGMPESFEVTTPSIRRDSEGNPYYSHHHYLLTPQGYDVTLLPGAGPWGEIRRSVAGEQSMVLGAYALRPDGIYEVTKKLPLAVAPESFLQFLVDTAGGVKSGPSIRVTGDWVWDETMGSRHDHLRDCIRGWRGSNPDRDTLLRMLREYIERHHIPRTRPGGVDIDDAELERMVDGALRKFGDDTPQQRAEYAGKRKREKATAAVSGLNLPAAFWDARPLLADIRKLAWSVARSPDAVFGSVLATLAAGVPHDLGLPDLIGAPKSLGLHIALVGPPGSGKSTSFRVGSDAIYDKLPTEPKRLPAGSGEGIAEAMMGTIPDPTPGAKAGAKVRAQVIHNLLPYVDEGSKPLTLSARNGSTLLPTWRSAFDGETLGEANASAERGRIIERGSYSFGQVVGFQPELLGGLLEDVAAGTPQRFIFLSATDPDIPDKPPIVSRVLLWTWPTGGWATAPGLLGPWRHRIIISGSVADIIVSAGIENGRHGALDTWDAHANLLRLKVGALLAILDGRFDVSPDDWELAGIVMDTSTAVRVSAHAVIEKSSEAVDRSVGERQGRRAVASERVISATRILTLAERVLGWVKSEPGITRKAIRGKVDGPTRELMDAAIDLAIEKGWVEQKEEASRTDSPRVTLWPK